MTTIFCYKDQYTAVRDVMYDLGMPVSSRSPRPVSHDGIEMQGCEDVIFFHIVGHPIPLPHQLITKLLSQGVVALRYDDRYRRAAAEIKRIHTAFVDRKRQEASH